MPAQQRQPDPQDSPGAPEWMVTFSDCMTLLLTFFVLLISFSSFDDKVFKRMESALAEGLPSVGIKSISNDRAFEARPQIIYKKARDRGSEQPTPEGKHESNPSQSLDFSDFQNQKVFVLPSERVFWGRGVLMSSHGQQVLADVAALLKATTNRIIVSEFDLAKEAEPDMGLRRAWYVMRYFVEEQGLDGTRFSLSSNSTVGEEIVRKSHVFRRTSRAERALEIAVLERSIYD
jgi:chemotaxis protein MotB